MIMKLLGTCLLCLCCIGDVVGVNRIFYIGMKELEWNYNPSGMNTISGKPIAEDEHARIYLQPGPNRIGRVYKKVICKQYTDDTYTEEIEKPDWLGLMGPIMKAEVGDTIIIHAQNFASRPYSLHAHGVEYTKKNEGALYPDNTSGNDKEDDGIPPGGSYTYHWDVVPDQGPSAEDNDCVVRLYHSHVDAIKDVYSGIVGPLIICKEGVLDKKLKKTQNKEFVLLFTVMDENLSWYLDENIETYCSDPGSVDKEDADFIESNKMHSINGYMYGSLPGLSMCDNTQVTWYMVGVGNEVDIHSAYFHGQVLTHQYNIVDTLNLFPATMIQATMSPWNPGEWLLSCQVNDHFEGGMQAIYDVENCTGHKTGFMSSVRHYYMAAEEIIWNYGPTSTNQFTGQNLDDPESESATYFKHNEKRIGGSYKKAVYVEYTDATFTKKKQRSEEEKHLGLLGPIIWAEVGDTVKITFKNNASYPYSIQAHGVSYKKLMEGAFYNYRNAINDSESGKNSQASHVAPRDIFTYEWNIPYLKTSSMDDQNCLPWLYYSAVDVARDTNSGLVGPLLVCKSLSNNKVIDHNYFLLATIFDENKSWYLDDNIQLFTGDPQSVNKEDAGFQESNMMHALNGYMYGNLPGLEMCKGDTVRWHMIGLGGEIDMHGIHFTGNTFYMKGTTRDVATLFPHISYTVAMTPDNVGVFNVECMTADHYTGGMRQLYKVHQCNKKDSTFKYARKLTHYIAAEEVEWEYSPTRTWEYMWYTDENGSPGDVFLNKTRTSIGSKYKKVVYREYTDGTFRRRKERTKNEEHLAIMGPLLTANIDDRIQIIFKNMASRPYSIYAHGVKTDENDIKPTKPGQVQMYVWDVFERSGPSSQEINCLTWAYYSTVNQVKDTYSGLIGPLIVCKRNYFPLRFLREPLLHFSLLFMIFDENESWYLDDNIQTYSLHPEEVNKDDGDFIESNKMHNINGLMYGNLQGLTMMVGDTVNWHLIGLGNEVDIHTVHFHAHSLMYKRGETYQTDVFDLFPGTTETAVMKAKNRGTWFVHCHVDDHMKAGMDAVYTVL
ncbi:hypothetical protein GDO81_007442 [Engystomops pustulosus]|uniref:Ceruloplasmin n=1 Tax=Engystomops pustulosus TaxID=76066 RepID=A0AAV7C746_ENGPU|nr:hypothetical protein GDO81_007442 [Engystomops pustulosus]